MQSITWAHEDKRLKRLWEKKKGKVSENKWKEMLYIGQLSEFITENSRLQVASNAQKNCVKASGENGTIIP